MRNINTRFFFILVSLVALTAGALFGLHRLQAHHLADALLWQAGQAEKEGKLDRAAKFLGRYLEFARDDLDQRAHLGMILSDPTQTNTVQRRSRARFVIEQVLVKDPQRHELRQRVCRIAINERSFDVAKEHLNYLEKNQPESSETPYLLGLWHAAQNELAPAAKYYRQALQMEAGKAELYIQLVAVLQHLDFGKEKRHDEEIDRLIAAALAKAANDPGVLSLAAQHAQEKGDTRIALRYLEDGLKQNPTDARLYLALARVQRQNGKMKEAIAQLQLALTKTAKDQHYDLRWNLANLLLDEDRSDDAKKIIVEIREVNPLSADYLEARLQMQRGRWFEAAQQFERIRPALKSVQELTLQLDLYLGACYEQLEEPLQQRIALERATAADPTSLTARKGLASANWALGQTKEALQIAQDLIARTTEPHEAAQRRLEYVRMVLQSGQARQAKEASKIEEELGEVEKTLVKSLEVALLRADMAFLRGDKDAAETLLQEAIQEHPERHEPWLALIAFAASRGEPETAQRLMKTAEGRFQAKAAFRQAQVRFWMEHRPAEQVAELRRLEPVQETFTPSELSALWQSLAEAYYFAQQYADSARAFQQITKLPQHDQDIRLRMQLLEVVLLLDDDQQARSVLADIKRIEGEERAGADGSFGEALRLMRAGRRGQKDGFEQARHLLTVTAALRPNWHPVLQARAEIDELQGRTEQAIANYRQALDQGSRDPQAMKQLIHLLSQAHRFDEVDEVIARMQKLYGTTDEVVKGFVHNAFQRKDYQKAEYLAKQLVAKNSKNYRDHLWLGHILSMGGKSSAEAEQAFRRATLLAPQQPETWIGLVRYLASVGKQDAGRAEIENAAKAVPALMKELTLAQCFELCGAMAQADEQYKTALQSQPTSALVQRAAAEFYLRIDQPLRAEPLYRKIAARQTPASDAEVTAAKRGLALALARSNVAPSMAEALQLAGLRLDEKGRLDEASLATTVAEQLIQARVLGAIPHARLRGVAIRLLESLQQKNALQGDDQYLLVRLLAQPGSEPSSWPKQRALLHTLLANHPKSPRFVAFAAHRHTQQKEFNDAEQMIVRLEKLEQEHQTAPGRFGAIELRAQLLEARGQTAAAVVVLKGYAEQKDAAPARQLLLAGLQGRLGEYREAIDLCERVRKSGSNDYEAIVTALAILRQNKPSEAQPVKREHWEEQRSRMETTLRAALERNGKELGLRLQLADMMELQANYVEVEKLCREVLRDDPANLVALNNLAWLMGQEASKAAEALTLINRAIAKYGPLPHLLDTRAVVALKQGDFETSIRDLERVVDEAPTPTRLFHLSRAYEGARKVESGLALLRQANDMGLTRQQLHPVEQEDYQRAMAELSKRP